MLTFRRRNPSTGAGDDRMHDALKDIPDRILDNAIGALMQANTHAVFHDPGMEHREQMSVLNAALAGELFLKAIIAKEHPLLIFRDLFHLDQPHSPDLSIDDIIRSGRTYAFEHLPKLLWVTTGERLADQSSFEEVRLARNAVQHFCSPLSTNLREISLRFIYRNLDPLIQRHFGLYAIEYNEDFSIGYDYVVACLIGYEIEFSIPPDFRITEVSVPALLRETARSYRTGFGKKLLSAIAG